MDKSRKLSDAHTGAFQLAAATEHRHSNVLFHLKHEDVTQWNLQHLIEADNAGRHNVSDECNMEEEAQMANFVQYATVPEQNPRCERAKLLEYDPTYYPTVLEQELIPSS